MRSWWRAASLLTLSLGLSSMLGCTLAPRVEHKAEKPPTPDPEEVVLLQGGRFRVKVFRRDASSSARAARIVELVESDAAAPGEPSGRSLPLRSRDSAVLEFFTPNSWELLLKVLDGTASNGHFWVFLGAAGTTAYTATLKDTACGTERVYTNRPGETAPAVVDTTAFPGCAEPGPPHCREKDGVLCLGRGGRFRAEVEWADFVGNQGKGHPARLENGGPVRNDEAALFEFFGPRNWEVLVKVIDGCRMNGHFWVLAALATDIGHEVVVTDTVTGETRRYENLDGDPAAAVSDTRAFACQTEPSSDSTEPASS